MDMIYRIWMSLEWAKTAQLVAILLVLGLTVALVFAGLGLLVHALIGNPTVWSAVGVGGIVAVYVRRRQRGTEAEQHVRDARVATDAHSNIPKGRY